MHYIIMIQKKIGTVTSEKIMFRNNVISIDSFFLFQEEEESQAADTTAKAEDSGNDTKEGAADAEATKRLDGDEEEDKTWSEVDKDLSDLLHEGDEAHDDEEETPKERYDRFKKSDKAGKAKTETEAKANGAIAADGEQDKIIFGLVCIKDYFSFLNRDLRNPKLHFSIVTKYLLQSNNSNDNCICFFHIEIGFKFISV